MNLINYLPMLIKLGFLGISVFLILCAVFLALALIWFFYRAFGDQISREVRSAVRSDPEGDQISREINPLDRSYLQAFSVIQGAKRDALRIVKDANLRAQSIIKEAHTINKRSENLLEEEIERSADAHIQALERASGKFLKETVVTLEEVAEDIQTAALQQVDDFKDVMHKETIEAQKNVDTKVTASYEQVEKEMGEYRSRRMGEIDKKIYDIVYTITEKVIGKSLSITDHESLIFKVLDDIKQSGGLNARNVS